MSRKAKKKVVPPESVNVADFDSWVVSESKRTGKSSSKIVEEVFGDGFLVFIQEAGGQAWMDATQLYKPKEKKTGLDECIRLRKTFAPVAACVDHVRDSILGGGISTVINKPTDKFQKDLKERCDLLLRNIYQDTYSRGLDLLTLILLDVALTTGVGAAEVVYDKKDMNFWDYASISTEKRSVKVGKKDVEYILYDTIEPTWTELNGVARLKILDRAYKRLKLYRDPRSWEAKYWSLDEVAQKNEIITLSNGFKIRKLLKGKKVSPTILFHPWQLFWLVVNRKGYSEMGESIVMPVLGVAKILERILGAVGEGIYRAGNKKYFIICGTEKRPWSGPHIRNVMQQLKEASKKGWSTIPVPQGFNVEDIGGEVFDSSAIVEYFLRIIAHGMRCPSRVVGVDTKQEEVYTYRMMKLNLKMAIEHQLIKHHVWCEYGTTKTKKGGKASEPVYIPEIRFRTEDLLSKKQKLDMLIGMLNAANPLRPEVKLEIERELCRLMGWDTVLLPTQEEQKEELEEMQKLLEKKVGKKEKVQGDPEPQTEERQKERLKGMKERVKGGKGKAKTQGSTRIPSELKVKETEENLEESKKAKSEVDVNITIKTEPIKTEPITVKTEPIKSEKQEIEITVKHEKKDKKESEEEKRLTEEKLKTEKKKQDLLKKKKDVLQKIEEKVEGK